MHDVFRVKLKLTFPVVQCHIPDIFSRLSQIPLAVVVHIIWRCFSSYMQYGDWKWLKNTLDTACCVDNFNFSVCDLSVYISLSFWMCMYTEKQVFWSVMSSAI